MDRCQLCEIRKPKRHCPGVHGDICTLCCGNEREVTVYCPLDCEYLMEARRHEKERDVNPDEFPNKDIKVSEFFLRENEMLLLFLARSVLDAALEIPQACDNDIREALEAMIATYRTLESGLIYQTRPANPYAAEIQRRAEDAIGKFREETAQTTGLHSVRDSQILGLLVFLERMQIQHNNGRRLSRAFMSFLWEFFPAPEPEPRLTA